MYTLYIANKNDSSWSLRAWVPMRALSLPFEERPIPFEAASSRSKSRSFSPNGRAEPWRETAHEAEIAATGTIRADYRRSSPKTDG